MSSQPLRLAAIARSPFRAGQRAVTLAEMIVVATIIVVLTSAAVLGYSNLRTADELDSSARRIQTTLHRARALAINSSEPHEIAIDIDDRTFWVDNVSAANPAPKVDGLAFVTDNVEIAGVRIGSGLLQTTGEQRIAFDPDGSSPFAVIQLLRRGADPADDENFYTVRLFPHGEARVERTRVY